MIFQTREEKIKDRLRNISDMEHRYDELQMEKRQLESSLTKIPIHGRVDRNSRRQKVSFDNSLTQHVEQVRSISDMEHCYDELQMEKRHDRMDRNSLRKKVCYGCLTRCELLRERFVKIGLT